MMPFIPALNTAQVTVNQTQNGEKVANIFYVKNGSAWTPTTLLDLATAFRTWWETETRTERHVSTCLESIAAKDLTTASGIAVLLPPGLVNCGSITGEPEPGNVTLAVKLATGLAGRSNRGRTYWVGLAESQVNGNTVISAQVTAIVGNMNELSARINLLGHQLVVLSKYTGSTCNIAKCKRIPTARSQGLTTPVTAFASEGNVDSQRRRLAGRGT